jgi:hypothetical protein
VPPVYPVFLHTSGMRNTMQAIRKITLPIIPMVRPEAALSAMKKKLHTTKSSQP